MPPIIYPFEFCKTCKDFVSEWVQATIFTGSYITCVHAVECNYTHIDAREEKEEPYHV